ATSLNLRPPSRSRRNRKQQWNIPGQTGPEIKPAASRKHNPKSKTGTHHQPTGGFRLRDKLLVK
uniref:hypothetical protein n=1 Tax=Arthrobacter sp. Br18 TaxID=1312954 RepID=UPI001C1DF03F